MNDTKIVPEKVSIDGRCEGDNACKADTYNGNHRLYMISVDQTMRALEGRGFIHGMLPGTMSPSGTACTRSKALANNAPKSGFPSILTS